MKTKLVCATCGERVFVATAPTEGLFPLCEYECPRCGEGVATKLVAEPCWHCGEAPQYQVWLAEEALDVVGRFEYPPGLPAVVNLCGRSACAEALRGAIKEVMR